MKLSLQPCMPNGQATFKSATKTSGTSQLVSILSQQLSHLYSLLIWIYTISLLASWASSWSGQSPPPCTHSRSAAHRLNIMFSQQMETCLQMGCIMTNIIVINCGKIGTLINCSICVAMSMLVYQHQRLIALPFKPWTLHAHRHQQQRTCDQQQQTCKETLLLCKHQRPW